MKLTLNPEYNLYEQGSNVFCDSLQVAETFEKRHEHVLRDITETLEALRQAVKPKIGFIKSGSCDAGPLKIEETYFVKTSYRDELNRKRPKYLLTKDGFALLAMGFTGKKAMAFKIEFIERFNQMEQFIKTLNAAKLEHPAFTKAIMEAHDEPKHYHYSNEADMINRIVLGVSAKQFREDCGIQPGQSIRPFLSDQQIKAIEELQRIDVGLICNAGI